MSYLRLAALTLSLTLLFGGCWDRGSTAPQDDCEQYVERMMRCNEPARLETWLVPTGDPGIPLRNCMHRMNEPRIRDGVRCALASEGRCEQLYECREWTSRKHSSWRPDPTRAPPRHMSPGDAAR